MNTNELLEAASVVDELALYGVKGEMMEKAQRLLHAKLIQGMQYGCVSVDEALAVHGLSQGYDNRNTELAEVLLATVLDRRFGLCNAAIRDEVNAVRAADAKIRGSGEDKVDEGEPEGEKTREDTFVYHIPGVGVVTCHKV